jgi:hypothetical protein
VRGRPVAASATRVSAATQRRRAGTRLDKRSLSCAAQCQRGCNQLTCADATRTVVTLCQVAEAHRRGRFQPCPGLWQGSQVRRRVHSRTPLQQRSHLRRRWKSSAFRALSHPAASSELEWSDLKDTESGTRSAQLFAGATGAHLSAAVMTCTNTGSARARAVARSCNRGSACHWPLTKAGTLTSHTTRSALPTSTPSILAPAASAGSIEFASARAPFFSHVTFSAVARLCPSLGGCLRA